MTERHRKIFAQYLEGKTDPEYLTVPMQLHLATATGKGMPQWYASNGALGKFELLGIDSDADSKIYRYRVELGGNRYRLGIRVADGKVAQIFCW